MEKVCSLCGKHIQYVPPMDDNKKIPSMCAKCSKDQDGILAELVEEEKRIKKYRKGINEPPGYNR